ncbi:tetratricopeptide repeat protein [Alteriqipengyuania sp. WL0013]|uniref:tetratricopeptide repeat protein n=1 Tax=Alteriqipengyuania sp. WL0013 TaxID=3110773 RepID=UPI002CABF277|nr:tetratricopeptide repeat protein [Alteriqipengyuania sp. WL0013]MEB3414988.1 tetratricopeptide repeat protein [Alteriqipengyuania sp. WL0013]
MNCRARFLAPIAAATLLAGCTLSPADRAQRAEDAMAQGDFAAAKLDLVTALKDKPGDAELLMLLARTQLELGDGEGALQTLRQLDISDPQVRIMTGEAELVRGMPERAWQAVEGWGTADAKRIQALSKLALGDVAGAEARFVEGTSASGPKARLLAEYARFELARGNRRQARDLVERAKLEDADAFDVLLADGQIHAAQGRPADALAAFKAALARNSGNRAANIGHVAMLAETGKLDEATSALEGFAGEDERLDTAHLAALIAAKREKWNEVRDILQSREGQLADMPQADLLYAQALKQLDLGELARARLVPLLRRYPGQRDVRLLLAQVQYDAGDRAGALKTLEPVAGRGDASGPELSLLARAARATGDPRAAAFAGRAALPSGQRFAMRLSAADRALQDSDWSEAVAAYRDVLAMSDGKNAMVLNNLAYALGRTGKAGEGLDYAARAVRLAPDNAAVLDTAAVLMLETGRDRARALELLRKAARLAPGNAEIKRHLAEAERTN